MPDERDTPKSGMTPEFWRTVSAAVDAALELRPEERVPFVERAYDEAIAREACEFLRAYDRAESDSSFLNVAACEYAAPVLNDLSQALDAARLAAGAALTASLAGRYAIDGEVGRGGMATVYLARDLRHDRPVAVKLLHPELAGDAEMHYFKKEIKRTAQLQHPHVVTLIDSGEVDGLQYFVMPYMEGGTLRHRLRDEQKLAPRDAVDITIAIADALEYAHRQGLVHGDVKPENVLFSTGVARLADFGIARPLRRGDVYGTTGDGVVRATLAYMSPEQASGVPERIDGRSDVFSLACVLYEMLTGIPAFASADPEVAIHQRLTLKPPNVRAHLRSIPAALDAIVLKALSLLPQDRFRTAGDFAGALRALPRNLAPSGSTLEWLRSHLLDRRVLPWGTAALVVAGAAVFGTTRWDDALALFASTDTTIVAALPLTIEGDGAIASTADDALLESFAHWRGISFVNRFQVAYALNHRGPIRSARDAAATTRSLGAGRYVRGSLRRSGDAWRVYVGLFDVRHGEPLFEVSEAIPNDLAAATAALGHLGDALILRGARTGRDSTRTNDMGTHSLPAVQANDRAQRALDDWDLSAADSLFQSALRYDAFYPRANLWLAQVRAWRGLESSTWSVFAERALANTKALSDEEQRLAQALDLLAARRFPAACGVYDALRRQNPNDFAAWFGLGQCRTLDRLVVRDASSPSGWAFRSSYREAMSAYGKAFQILPSVHRSYEADAFARLRTLFVVSRRLIAGFGAGPDSVMFYARPGWLEAGDTIALIPYPARMVLAGLPEAIPPGFTRALRYQVEQFRTIVANWSTAFPRSAGAKRAVAISLELLGDPAAIDTLRSARRLASDAPQRLQLAVAEIMLRVKFGLPNDLATVAPAIALADSLLAIAPLDAKEAEWLAPIASLRGRCGLAESLIRRAGLPSGPIPVSPELFIDARASLARVSLGCSSTPFAPTIRALMESIDGKASSAKYAARRWIGEVLLYRPALLSDVLDSTVVARLAEVSDGKLLHAAGAATRHDTAAVRNSLSEFADQWRVELGAPTPDIVYPGSRLWLSIGDTTMAIQWLDRALSGLRTYDPETLQDQARVAALVRTMLLRAELAGGRGDRLTMNRWATAAAMLWSGADLEQQQLVRQAGQPHRGH